MANFVLKIACHRLENFQGYLVYARPGHRPDIVNMDERGKGQANTNKAHKLDRATSVSHADPFDVESCIKPFEAIAIARLVGQSVENTP
jgi:hypothetical protein